MENKLVTMTPDAEKSDGFTAVQYAFTRHIRDPENYPAPGDVEDRRMGIYRDLLYNNVESFIANSFPVLREITPEHHWHAMVRDYFSRHKATTPFFPKMPQEFLKYLQQERQSSDNDYPFILELAHYEWIEMEVSFDGREIEMDDVDTEGDLLALHPVLSPLVWPLEYRFPVHRISPDFLPDTEPEQATYLLVYRDRQDNVGFLELNPVSARLVELLRQNSAVTGREVLRQIADELKHPNPDTVISGGYEMLENMRQKDVILGTSRT